MIQFIKKLFANFFTKKRSPDIVSEKETPAVYSDMATMKEMDDELSRKQVIENNHKPGVYPDIAIIKEMDEELSRKQLGQNWRKKSRWSMRNNTILIKYNNQCQNWRKNGQFESMRCTKLKRAEEIAANIRSYCIEKIVFADHTGKQFIIKSFN